MTKPKYTPGPKIETFAELHTLLQAGKCVYFMGKVYHINFLGNWQYRLLDARLRQGQFFRAIPAEAPTP